MIAKILGWILSPTRMLFDLLKEKANNRGKFHRSWSRFFIYAELSFALAASAITAIWPDFLSCVVLSVVLLLVAWSRINELVFAFYWDALSHLKNEEQASDLKPYERLQMALKSYIGLIIYFSIIYYFNWLQQPFKPEHNNFFESAYFSVITITTLGYGDFQPAHWLMKAFSMYEALTGLLMVVVVIAAYIGADKKAVKLHPLAVNVMCTDVALVVDLSDGRSISAPLVWFPRLSQASSVQRDKWTLLGDGEGIHWPDIDEDLSVAGLLLGSH